MCRASGCCRWCRVSPCCATLSTKTLCLAGEGKEGPVACCHQSSPRFCRRRRRAVAQDLAECHLGACRCLWRQLRWVASCALWLWWQVAGCQGLRGRVPCSPCPSPDANVCGCGAGGVLVAIMRATRPSSGEWRLGAGGAWVPAREPCKHCLLPLDTRLATTPRHHAPQCKRRCRRRRPCAAGCCRMADMIPAAIGR